MISSGRSVVLFWLILLISLGNSVPQSQDSWFDWLDTNHDHQIDQQEFQDGLSKLRGALKGTVPPADTSTTTTWSFLTLPEMHINTHGFWKAFTSSVAMILATEIGDKTFFIAAVLSMRFDRSAVFTGAIAGLIIMTVLSTLMGQVLPNILPKSYTHILGGILFLYFGGKLLLESKSMEANKVSEELEEVEEELHYHPKRKQEKDEESGTPMMSRTSSNVSTSSSSGSLQKSWHAVAWQSLTLTFLAEWGDRSQIATIALAAAKNPYGVTVGGCVGHTLCTGLATIGGRMLAARISEKSVAFYGGLIFLVFGVHSLFFET